MGKLGCRNSLWLLHPDDSGEVRLSQPRIISIGVSRHVKSIDGLCYGIVSFVLHFRPMKDLQGWRKVSLVHGGHGVMLSEVITTNVTALL
jgi:hypothetical protein